jgi:hypothetical protein
MYVQRGVAVVQALTPGRVEATDILQLLQQQPPPRKQQPQQQQLQFGIESADAATNSCRRRRHSGHFNAKMHHRLPQSTQAQPLCQALAM